jgi:hypothetical protein
MAPGKVSNIGQSKENQLSKIAIWNESLGHGRPLKKIILI